MFKLCLSLILLTLVSPVVFGAGPARTPSASSNEGGARLRPHDSRATAVVLDGLQRSDTVRTLVKRLEKKDVIVYLQMQPGLDSRLAGRLNWMAATSEFRYVRVSLHPQLSGDAAVAALGHELQHAVEIAEQPSIVDAASLAAHYRRHGISMPGHTNGWDTLAARLVGDEVRRELLGSRGTRVAESIQGR